MKAVTHDGIFHADDVVAGAILYLYAEGSVDSVEIVRSRDPKETEYAKVIFDVGGRYFDPRIDPASGQWQYWLDHHQPGGAGKRENGIPYAAAGLMWSVYGNLIMQSRMPKSSSCAEIRAAADWIDERFIQAIDAADNGVELFQYLREDVRPMTFSGLISSMNPTWNEVGDYDARYFQAVAIAEEALDSCIQDYLGRAEARAIVEKALTDSCCSQVLVLERSCPWQEHLLSLPGNDKALYVVYEQKTEKKTTWMVQCVPDKLGSFGKRKALPELWAGLRCRAETAPDQAALEDVTGVSGAIFCHPGRFICGASTKDAALDLARIACDFEPVLQEALATATS